MTPALSVVNEDPEAGFYLSAAADTFRYYTYGSDPRIHWEAATKLYAQGADAIRQAVEQRMYQAVIVRSVSSAGPDQDELLRWLELSPDYESREPAPGDGLSEDRWLVYRLVNTTP